MSEQVKENLKEAQKWQKTPKQESELGVTSGPMAGTVLRKVNYKLEVRRTKIFHCNMLKKWNRPKESNYLVTEVDQLEEDDEEWKGAEDYGVHLG